MSGDVLPFQLVYAGHTNHSPSTPAAPEYHQATEVLKFHFESRGANYESTLSTMKSYVQHILVPYFEQHRENYNQICIWQIDCLSGMSERKNSPYLNPLNICSSFLNFPLTLRTFATLHPHSPQFPHSQFCKDHFATSHSFISVQSFTT